MGLGNGNAKSGDLGSNFNYELKSLQGLAQSVAILNTLATESTLISVLNAIIAADQDLEILLVRDNGNGGLVVQQITNWETGTPVISYKDVDGNPYIPVGPLEYLDPSAVMNLVLTELLDQGLSLDSIVTNTLNTVNGITTANVTLNDIENELIALNNTAGTLSLEATQLLVKAVLDAIQVEQLAQGLSLDSIVTNTTPATNRTPNFIRSSASSNIAIAVFSVSVYNAGLVNGTVLGTTILPGETLSFDAGGDGNKFTAGSFTYDGTGTDLAIIYVS